MKRAEGATPSRRFSTPSAAEMSANGIISFSTSSAPCENGSNTGNSRFTLSMLNDETDAMLPVLKNADCRSTKKNSATRASESFNGRNCDAAAAAAAPTVVGGALLGLLLGCLPAASSAAVFECRKTCLWCSNLTQVSRVRLKAK